MVAAVLPSPIDRPVRDAAQGGLQRIVELLAQTPDVALARIWLLQTAQTCDVCQTQTDLAADDCSLHLAASAGRSRRKMHPEIWNRLDGASHRFPLRSQKIGRIGATGEPLIVRHAAGAASLTNPEWLRREGIESFFGAPLTQEGRNFGVLAVFSRRQFLDADLMHLHQVAESGARLLFDANRLAEQSDRLKHLERENHFLRTELECDGRRGSLIAASAASQKWSGQIQLAAAHDQPVLITGEHGAGKEYTARLIHAASRQARGSFLRLCGSSLTLEMLQAMSDRDVPSLAARTEGTLFLDAVERTPEAVQSQLANFVLGNARRSRQRSARAGVDRPRILASSLDLQGAVAARHLQHELYCALSVGEIRVPPLRERGDDFAQLCEEILGRICRGENRDLLRLDPVDLERLRQSDWCGNVRQLHRVLETAVWQSEGPVLTVPCALSPLSAGAEAQDAAGYVRRDVLKRRERANILACLKECQGKVYGSGGAAERLGMKPTTLLYRMKILGIRKPPR